MVKSITRQEINHIEKLNYNKQAEILLGLVVNKKLKVNDFTGKVKELSSLLSLIKEKVK